MPLGEEGDLDWGVRWGAGGLPELNAFELNTGNLLSKAIRFKKCQGFNPPSGQCILYLPSQEAPTERVLRAVSSEASGKLLGR